MTFVSLNRLWLVQLPAHAVVREHDLLQRDQLIARLLFEPLHARRVGHHAERTGQLGSARSLRASSARVTFDSPARGAGCA